MPHFVDLQLFLEERLHSFHQILKGLHDPGMQEPLVHYQWQRPPQATETLLSWFPASPAQLQPGRATSLSLLPPVFLKKLLFSF